MFVTSKGGYRILRGRVNSVGFLPDERLILYLELAGFGSMLKLPINGNAVTGISSISKPATLCYELLGRSPSEGKFARLRFSWLKANFEYLSGTANEWEVMQAVRAYIMHFIGGVLMSDANGNSGVVSWRSSTPTVQLHTVYPNTASTIRRDPWDEQEGEVWK
ncbi:hypothetical protein PVK06_002950 [Gossypium arboreum]|uniref:Uncharacterized protein n=1 Tax=Gossypium arboreum TaxID=29729 RepID=A0ABR0R6C7_GOSAR|nr:hypothetical protein PVK06_002950 [Gossypium arboreum]